jgi:hypothetical protein
MMKEAP